MEATLIVEDDDDSRALTDAARKPTFNSIAVKRRSNKYIPFLRHNTRKCDSALRLTLHAILEIIIAAGPRLDRVRDGQAADRQRHNLP
jgi:hypothetical protein